MATQRLHNSPSPLLNTVLQRFLESRPGRAPLQGHHILSIGHIALVETGRIVRVLEIGLTWTLEHAAHASQAERRPVRTLEDTGRRRYPVDERTVHEVLPGGSVVHESAGRSAVNLNTLLGLIRSAPLRGEIEVISRRTLVDVGVLLQGTADVVDSAVAGIW